MLLKTFFDDQKKEAWKCSTSQTSQKGVSCADTRYSISVQYHSGSDSLRYGFGVVNQFLEGGPGAPAVLEIIGEQGTLTKTIEIFGLVHRVLLFLVPSLFEDVVLNEVIISRARKCSCKSRSQGISHQIRHRVVFKTNLRKLFTLEQLYKYAYKI